MNGPNLQQTLLLSPPAAARATAAFDRLGRTLRAALRAMRPTSREAQERAALRGLSAHVLADIGASPWLVADAVNEARDACRALREPGLF